MPGVSFYNLPAVNNFLLAKYPGAAAAFSLRKLSPSYTSNAIRIRRASDNAEQDIGFTGEDLDTAAVNSFCSGTNGFIATWYDQSGNSRNATQVTAASQPKIYDNSTGIVLTNGKPSLRFEGSQFLGVSGALSSQPNSYFIVKILDNPTTASAGNTITDGTIASIRRLIDVTAGSRYRIFAGSIFTTTVTANNTQTLLFTLFNGASSSLAKNNGAVSSGNAGTLSGSNIRIGTNVTAAFFLIGNINEFIIYNSNQTTNRTGIETNINNYYNIYP